MELYCLDCQTAMTLVAKTIPFGLELIYQCSRCQHKFMLDPEGRVYRMVDYPSTDFERAAYNRKIVANHWFDEGYREVEQWFEEHPLEDYWERTLPAAPDERRGDSVLDRFLQEGRGGNSPGVDYPEGRR